jgi:hypothetical protein
MSLDNSHSPCPVRLFGICPEERIVLASRLGFLRLLRLDSEASARWFPRRNCSGSD